MAETVKTHVISVVKRASCFDMEIEAAGSLAEAAPGQFVMIKCADKTLRRPISVCDLESGRMRLVFEPRGEGTKWLSGLHEGDILDVLGPLGKGFDLAGIKQPVIFVGGGIGVPPLLYALKKCEVGAAAVLGFRTEGAVILESDFKRALSDKPLCGDCALTVTTDDGSYGEHGFAAGPLARLLEKGKWGAVLACGPKPMLRAVSELAEKYSVPCQVSMEQRMGCGVGACLVCSCAVKHGEEHTYARVCRDGPVFDSREVDWDA